MWPKLVAVHKNTISVSNAIMSLLISHILTFVESELVKNEPAMMAALEADIRSLIAKLESMLAAKSASVAAVVNPVLNVVSHVAVDAMQAAGQSIAQGVQTPQSVE